MASQPSIPDSARGFNEFLRRETDRPFPRTHALVGGAAVQMRAQDQRRLAGILLRQQGAEDAGEDVAHAGGGHAGVAGGA